MSTVTTAKSMISEGTLTVSELCTKLNLSEGSVNQWLNGRISGTSSYVEQKVRDYLATLISGSASTGASDSTSSALTAKEVNNLITEHDKNENAHEILARKDEVLSNTDETITKMGMDFNKPLKLLELDEDGGVPYPIKVASDPTVEEFGDITNPPTFKLDTPHTGYIKKSIALKLPIIEATAKKLKNILFDFNITPDCTLTYPTNGKWDYDAEPSLAYFPDLSYKYVTIGGMIVTCAGTSGQYADLTNVAFNNLGTKTWEMIWNMTPATSGALQTFVSNNKNSFSYAINISASNHFMIYLSSDGTTWNMVSGATGSYTVVNGVNVYVKLAYDGYNYTLSVSPDGLTYTTDISVVSPYNINATTLTGNIRLGQWSGGGTANLYIGTFDLNKSSVKIAGGRNLLTLEDGVYLNRIIWDTMDKGNHYKSHYSQVVP